jgi:hypothetical protein
MLLLQKIPTTDENTLWVMKQWFTRQWFTNVSPDNGSPMFHQTKSHCKVLGDKVAPHYIFLNFYFFAHP